MEGSRLQGDDLIMGVQHWLRWAWWKLETICGGRRDDGRAASALGRPCPFLVFLSLSGVSPKVEKLNKIAMGCPVLVRLEPDAETDVSDRATGMQCLAWPA